MGLGGDYARRSARVKTESASAGNGLRGELGFSLGPATASDTAWFRQAIAQAPSRFALATHHRYSLLDETGVPATNFRYPTIANLLSDTLRKDELAFDKGVVAAANRYGVGARLTELNTGDLGGKVGVSDVFASAPWAVDHLFVAAEAGLVGVNVNMTIGAGTYGPVHIVLDGTLTDERKAKPTARQSRSMGIP